jgi:hypothetical protein
MARPGSKPASNGASGALRLSTCADQTPVPSANAAAISQGLRAAPSSVRARRPRSNATKAPSGTMAMANRGGSSGGLNVDSTALISGGTD